MFSAVTNWLGVTNKENINQSSNESIENTKNLQQPLSDSSDNINTTSEEDSTSSKLLPEIDTEAELERRFEEESQQDASVLLTLEDVSSKAFSTAKEVGNILFTFGKAAGKTVVDQANRLKSTIEDKTLLGDFGREQDNFVTWKTEMKRQESAAIAPWVGFVEEEVMKRHILALSMDRRNFLRNPPSGVKFQFDFDSVYPVAMATLHEDASLQKMRFDLVPKIISEKNFWRNYFYRVSLIKQSTQLSSLAQQREGDQSTNSSHRSSDVSEHVNAADTADLYADEEGQLTSEEFVSDAYSGHSVADEIVQLKVVEGCDLKEGDIVQDWEKELQEFELVSSTDKVIDDPDLEREILQQIGEMKASS